MNTSFSSTLGPKFLAPICSLMTSSHKKLQHKQNMHIFRKNRFVENAWVSLTLPAFPIHARNFVHFNNIFTKSDVTPSRVTVSTWNFCCWIWAALPIPMLFWVFKNSNCFTFKFDSKRAQTSNNYPVEAYRPYGFYYLKAATACFWNLKKFSVHYTSVFFKWWTFLNHTLVHRLVEHLIFYHHFQNPPPQPTHPPPISSIYTALYKLV